MPEPEEEEHSFCEVVGLAVIKFSLDNCSSWSESEADYLINLLKNFNNFFAWKASVCPWYSPPQQTIDHLGV